MNLYPTHTNHEKSVVKDITVLSLPKTVKVKVSEQLAVGVSVKRILSDARGGAGSLEQRGDGTFLGRSQLITRQDVYNIGRHSGLRSTSDKDDANAVFHRVNAWRTTNYNPVLLYKTYGDNGVMFEREYGEDAYTSTLAL